MFDTKKETKSNFDYSIHVDAARTTKNDSIIMFDMTVNGISIKSCMLKEITVKKDGEVHKKGDKCYVVNFPSEKVGDKYYNRVWFPVTNKHIDLIISQIQSLLD